VFFYSFDIFKNAGLTDPVHIQYAILCTGVVNVASTFLCIPLIDRYGRRRLLLVTLGIIVLNFLLLTVCLALTPTPHTTPVDTILTLANGTTLAATATTTTTTIPVTLAGHSQDQAFGYPQLFRLITTPQYLSVACIMVFIVCFAVGLGRFFIRAYFITN
jgi:MFS family permease